MNRWGGAALLFPDCWNERLTFYSLRYSSKAKTMRARRREAARGTPRSGDAAPQQRNGAALYVFLPPSSRQHAFCAAGHLL